MTPKPHDLQIMPKWDNEVPFCSASACPEYDGKRCRVTGFRPNNICEPAVRQIVEALRNGTCPCQTDLQGAPPWHAKSCVYADPNYDDGGVL